MIPRDASGLIEALGFPVLGLWIVLSASPCSRVCRHAVAVCHAVYMHSVAGNSGKFG